MKVLRLHQPFDLRFHEEAIPETGPDDVLVKIRSVGICASDIHYYSEGKIGDQVPEKPIVLGHEFSATVVKVGDRVRSLVEGARVAVEPSRPCRECPMCRLGNINVCPDVKFFGTPPTDGCLREYLAWPAELCLPVSESVSVDEAAMIEPLAVGVYAVDLAEIAGRETIAVLGAGAIGLSVIQAARIAGVGKIIVSEPIAERRELAGKFGADVLIDPNALDSTAAICEHSDGGAEIVFECAGTSVAISQTPRVAAIKGRIIIVGIPSARDYTFDASLSRRRGLNVQFVRRSKNTAERCIELVERKMVQVAPYATHFFPFDRSEDAFKLAMAKTNGVVRAIVRVSEENSL